LVTYHAALLTVKINRIIKVMKNKRFMKEGVGLKQQMHNGPPSISIVKEKQQCYKIFNNPGKLPKSPKTTVVYNREVVWQQIKIPAL
jgi:hypothetical protein